ncbi:MAG: peptidylprolyl isomerase [Methanomassiliicoccaceae archaeon]|jgi:FKBP-type peptidyl-prolyl cis-trans isomerase 2|nr:peptidylprolyl isomerase [Methanomassiliicoccaceae archaeon]
MAAAKKTVSKGDLVYIDYDAFLADNDKLFDTTMAESAKNAGFFDEKFEYGPMPVLLGSGALFKALEDAIEGAAVGKETEVEIASADAAGARDPKLIETFPLKKFQDQDIHPGAEVQTGNRRGTIMRVGSGRVIVDFNNPLAGKDLIYKFKITEVVSDAAEKAKAVVKMALGTSEGLEVTITDDKISVILPDRTKFDQNWQIARFRVVSDLRKVTGLEIIEFIEVWGEKKKAEDAEQAEAAEEKPKDEEPKDDEKPKKKTSAAKKKSE